MIFNPFQSRSFAASLNHLSARMFLYFSFCVFPLANWKMRFGCSPSLSSRAARCRTVPTLPPAFAVVCVHKLGCAFLFFAYCTVSIFVHAVPLNNSKQQVPKNVQKMTRKKNTQTCKKQQKTLQLTCQWLRPLSQCILRCAPACPSANEQENWASCYE